MYHQTLCQIKTIRYHYILLKMVKMQNTGNNKCWQGYGATEKTNSHSLLMGMGNGTATLFGIEFLHRGFS